MLLLCLALIALATTSGDVAAAPQPACAAGVVDPAASALAQLARELRRYIWHVTARWLRSTVPSATCHRVVGAWC